jgi:hypothetical protein
VEVLSVCNTCNWAVKYDDDDDDDDDDKFSCSARCGQPAATPHDRR